MENKCKSCTRQLGDDTCFIPLKGREGELSTWETSTDVLSDDGSCEHYDKKTVFYNIKHFFDMKAYSIKNKYWSIRSFFIHKLYGHIKYGFNISDTWNLDSSISEYIAPRIRYLAKNTHGHPGLFDDDKWLKDNKLTPYTVEDKFETWKNILNRIADGFDKISNDDKYGLSDEEVAYKKETFRLLELFYDNLWD